MKADPTLSVVVPTLDEARHLPALLGDLEGLTPDIVVVDGGSRDATVAEARRAGARIVRAAPCRGGQLRAGAAAARGEWIFFVHADCRLNPTSLRQLRTFLDEAGEDDFAHFGFRLDGDRAIHRFIEVGQRLRERFLGLVYGDQGLVVSRSLYRRVGGHPPWPLMEDVAMVRRLERVGRRVALPAALTTSARRYDAEGGLRRWARNVGIMALFHLGASPETLSRWYAPRRGRHVGAVGVFAKAPTPGRVKTRLAADVGATRAARIYRTLGRSIVDGLRGGAFGLVVYVDPPDEPAFRAVRDWLGPGLKLRPQSDGDLGRRMCDALEELLEETDRALLVGTDTPGIDREIAQAALDALAEHDLVVGPSTDGGYYLIGMSRPLPALFEDVAWSTGDVLPETLKKAEKMGLTLYLMDTKTDVDTVADLPVGFVRDPESRA